MATVDLQMHHAGRDLRCGPVAGRRHGRENLAEVIAIRPARAHRAGFLGSLVTKARVFASPRVQATSVRPTPRPPSSPASRTSTAPSPDDAA